MRNRVTAAVGLLCAVVLVGTAAFAQNSSQYLWDTIPATMVPGFSYSVAVTMRNTGSTTWTKATNYKLGAVGDSDPFAQTRFDLGNSDSIAPGQEKSFSFTMVAPTAGVYTTDWRMLQEGVQWFGDTLTKQVDVTFGPNPPGAPVLQTPVAGNVICSNRPEIKFSGDPFDAYEIHIGSVDAPTSNNYWDSGVVYLAKPDVTAWAIPNALPTQAHCYLFVRLRNPNGWGPWSQYNNHFYVAAEMPDPMPTAGQPVIGPNGAQRGHSICYNPDAQEYLLAYYDAKIGQTERVSYCILDSNGFIKAGTSERTLEHAMGGARGPVVCYNSVLQEYMLVYCGWVGDGASLHDQVWGLRINPGGEPKGSQVLLFETGWLWDPAIAYAPPPSGSGETGTYLLAWYNRGGGAGWPGDMQVQSRLLRANGASGITVGSSKNLSQGAAADCGAPIIVSRPAGNEFYVVFAALISEAYWHDLYGRRVSAATGDTTSGNIVLAHNPQDDGGADLVYVPELDKYLLGYTSAHDGTVIWGQFLDSSGLAQGSPFTIQTSSPSGGGNVQLAWHPTLREFLATWMDHDSYNDYGRRLSETGAPMGERFQINGTVWGDAGNFYPVPVANTDRDEFLICWYNSYTDIYTRRYKPLPLPPVDTTPPARVTSFTATPGDTQVHLNWTNPADSDFVGAIVVGKTGSYPTGPFDGTVLGDFWGAPGSIGTCTHTGLINKTTYYYCAYSHDIPNYGTAAQARAVPVDTTAPTPVTGFSATATGNEVALSWDNSADPDSAGTMIRFKYTGCPTSRTDGYLLCDRPGSPGSHDSFTHAGVGSATYYYSAFAYDAAPNYSGPAGAQATPDCLPDQFVSDTFDSYALGDLGGQGSWITTGAASAQVESTFVKGGVGKSVVMDPIASGGLSVANEITFLDKASGYYYLSLDVAQDAAGGTWQEVASVAFHGSTSNEIAKLHIQNGRLTIDHSLGSYTLTSAVNATWYNVRIGFDVDARRMNLWLDGVPKGGAGFAWKGDATGLSRIVISSSRNTSLSPQKAYVDNLAIDIKPGSITDITDDGAWTPSSSHLHFSIISPPCVGEYRYCIGTTPGGTEARGWTSCGTSTDVLASGLSLVDNQIYYVTAQAGTGHGNWGASKTSDGITVAPALGILAVKALADGASNEVTAIRGRVVSAFYAGCFYIQDRDRINALKIVSSAVVSEGDVVDVCGVIKGAGSERYIECVSCVKVED